MKNLSMLQLLARALFLTTMLLTTPPATSAAGLTIRADLTHVDSGRGFTKRELLSRMAARSSARAASLHHPPGGGGGGGGGGHYNHPATASAAPGTVGEPSTEYLIHLGIGTPQPQHVALTLDTGSDLVWTQCKPCPDCFDQPSPMFDPSASKTIYAVSCNDPLCAQSGVAACYIRSHGCFYLETYGDKSIAAGTLARDTFTFKAPSGGKAVAVVPNLAFGCGLYNMGVFETNESGIAGFGRGQQSLPSQLKVGRFSYCFTSMFESSGKSSPVFLGTPDDITAHATGPVQSTPMPRYGDEPYYSLIFKGITVGATRLPIDESVFARKRDGSGGTIIDSGSGITTFPLAVYDQIASAFVSQIHLPVVNASEAGGRLCFYLNGKGEEKVRVPKLVFHLEGADMELPRENYMYGDEEAMCLSINGADGDDTIIGNFQQQNMHVVYDLNNNKLFFAPAQCDKL